MYSFQRERIDQQVVDKRKYRDKRLDQIGNCQKYFLDISNQFQQVCVYRYVLSRVLNECTKLGLFQIILCVHPYYYHIIISLY